MTEEPSKSRNRKKRGVIVGSALVIFLAAGFVVWSSSCPCDRTPGGYLFGDAPDGVVTDWSFANDVPLCQIQVSMGLIPYSINLNCMATTAGELYVSCGACETKGWGGRVIENGRSRIRLGESVYPVTATRVLNPDELDRAWGARVAKLQLHSSPLNPAAPLDAARADNWWSFHVVSR
jgi:hypothetical protein